MSLLGSSKLAVIALAGVGGTVGVVYVGEKVVDFSGVQDEDDSIIETISDKYKTRLVKAEAKSNKWDVRLKKLRSWSGSTLDQELQKIKSDNGKKGEDLKNWCESAAIQPYEKDSLVTQGVEAFCTLTIKDQANGTMSTSKKDISDWKEVNKVFSELTKDSLSEDLQSVWDKVKSKVDTSLDLKEWCFKKYDEPFVGKDNALYKEVVKVCKAPKPAPAKPNGSTTSASGTTQAGDI
ncbi:hypothetical protein MHC_02895 [Mycoplasma haemocanis str. Illinois]|uniref:Uncharacterized protein n=1 Tax=Mycoplasma haemocanis (strain Illinois) TaxID=1111676 RepID=H6N719_MYCHN|nr:hypothetical protein [Mycoplasma haemocanis]AEW45441.1 hypothetical protein MHC_02895 [Mycoplasma haemocanis str. Illinois]